MVIVALGAIVVLVAGVLLVRLARSLEPNQRVVLIVLVLLVVGFLSYSAFRAYRTGVQFRQEQGR